MLHEGLWLCETELGLRPEPDRIVAAAVSEGAELGKLDLEGRYVTAGRRQLLLGRPNSTTERNDYTIAMWGIHRRTFASYLWRMAWMGGQTSASGMTTMAVLQERLRIRLPTSVVVKWSFTRFSSTRPLCSHLR